MKTIKIITLLLTLSVSTAFANSVQNLKISSTRFVATLKNLNGSAEHQLVAKAEQICGEGNVVRIFEINTSLIGNFEITGTDESITSSDYPRLTATAKVECK